ncbi:hypothetical protein G9A89_005689 [Geosiphon pyriformis]|nr:hypothetical protein G9A89_005689 [Geosiphon pyriformis]
MIEKITWENKTCEGLLPEKVSVSIPLPISTQELLPKTFSKKQPPSRSMNCFFIYRKVVAKILQLQGYFDLDMNKIGQLAGRQWKIESAEIKNECRRLADEAKNLHCKFFGLPIKKKRKSRSCSGSRLVERPDGITQLQTEGQEIPESPISFTFEPEFYIPSQVDTDIFSMALSFNYFTPTYNNGTIAPSDILLTNDRFSLDS